jgi:hypothetical protein
MRRLSISSALALTLSLASPVRASTYSLTSGLLSWTDAEIEANSLGGHLVAINSAAEQALLVAQFGGTEYFWIGLTDQQVEGVFLWSNGDPLTYTNWVPGEPNNEFDEDYVLMNWNFPGGWNDGHNNSPPLRGIIETPEPVSVLLGGPLVGLLLLRARRTHDR